MLMRRSVPLATRTFLALLLGACGGGVMMQKGRDAGEPSGGGRPSLSNQSLDAGSMPAKDKDAAMLAPVGMPGQVDGNAPANSGLPPLPKLTNVKAQVVGDSVSMQFDPVLGAVDYRVYELPDQSKITAGQDGKVDIEDGVFRCAGNRQAPRAAVDGEEQLPGGAIKTLVDGQMVGGYKRSLSEATLGYVYAEAGEGRIPVYALGETKPNSDNLCYFQRWTASRRKQFITSATQRDSLLKQGFRDDGIAFYVPAKSGADTTDVYTSADADSDNYGGRYYFVSGPESAARKDQTVAFQALAKEASGTLPLMRVFYTNLCGQGHDELVAGKPRFDLVRKQGDQFPVTRLHWSGLTKSTFLVIEALDQGCPFQGVLAPMAAAAAGSYPAWVSVEAAQEKAPHHELYINGQFDGTSPRPIARSFVRVAPAPRTDLDWSFGFNADDDLGELAKTDITPLNCAEAHRAKSGNVDTQFYCPESNRFAQRSLFGEWWVMFTDLAADTNGKYRLTPLMKADMNANNFLYVTMDVDSFSTLRRYPQILISDRDVPVQNDLPNGNTLVLQTFADWPNTYELQVCDHKNWDVNDQCPRYDFFQRRDPSDQNKTIGIAPNVEVGEQVGLDYSNHWEIYTSTKRAYIFLDGQPYGCAELPTAGVPSGAVTVTFGDVLYHSGVDHLFDFTSRRLQSDSLRHFDNLGFKSHVSAPQWDEARLPCVKKVLTN